MQRKKAMLLHLPRNELFHVLYTVQRTGHSTEAEFLDVTWTTVFKSFPPCYSQSPLLTDYTPPPPPLEQNGLKLFCDENLKSENSQDYAQKHQ